MSFAAVLQRLDVLTNPYPGLRPFRTADAHLYYGRETQVSELVARLERNHFVAVVGVSGARVTFTSGLKAPDRNRPLSGSRHLN